MRKNICIIIILVLVLLSLCITVYGEQRNLVLKMNDVELSPITSGIIFNNTVMIPMRPVLESLGAVVSWDDQNKKVIVQYNEDIVALKSDSYFVEKNNKYFKLMHKVKNIEGRIYIPIDGIKEIFNIDVVRNDNNRTFNIENTQHTSKGSSTISNDSLMTLSYETAFDMAIKNSFSLQKNKLELEKSEKLLDDAGDKIQYSRPTGFGYSDEDALARAALISWINQDASYEIVKKDAELIQESLAYDLKNLMWDVLNLQNELKLFDNSLEIAKLKLKILQLKVDNGFESMISLEKEKQVYIEQEQKRKVLLDSIDGAFLKLNSTLGLSPSEKYDFDLQSDFTKIKIENDLDGYIRSQVSQDPYIWMQEKQVKAMESSLQLHVYNAGQQSYSVKKLELDKAKKDIGNMKEKMGDSIRSTYNSIMQLEKNYDVLMSRLNYLKQVRNEVQTYYDTGMTTEEKWLEANHAVLQLEEEILKLGNAHEKLLLIYEKPHLKPDYVKL